MMKTTPELLEQAVKAARRLEAENIDTAELTEVRGYHVIREGGPLPKTARKITIFGIDDSSTRFLLFAVANGDS